MYIRFGARRDGVKCHMRKVLDSVNLSISTLIFLIIGSTQVAMAARFEVLTYGLLQLQSDDDRCSIAKIHSLVEDNRGQIYHQSGMGWFILTSSGVGILTPFHVIAEGSAVYAECKGEIFELKLQKTDPEKDLAFLTTESKDRSKLGGLVFPVMMPLNPGEKSYRESLDEKARTVFSIVSPEVPDSEYKSNMRGLALSMTSFGVASAPNFNDRTSSLILSPDFENSVEPIIEDKDPLSKIIVRLDGLGIRPGLSGSALFGVMGASKLTHYNFEQNVPRKKYSLSVQWMPKILLGMVNKTRLNGAETVAISMVDIFEFLERLPLKDNSRSGLTVSFHRMKSKNGLELMPALNINNVTFVEYCGDGYKNSGSLSPLRLEDSGRVDSNWHSNKNYQFNDSTSISPVENQLLNRFRERDYKIPSTSDELKLPHFEDFIDRSAGGGDYGEGGDGFAPKTANFYLSSFPAFKLQGLRDDFKEITKFQTQGVYRTSQVCKFEGLVFQNKLVSEVNLPGKVAQRLATFEDLRRFYKDNGERSLGLIQEFGSNKLVWPYENRSELQRKPIQIPLISVSKSVRNQTSLSPALSPFFQEKFIPGTGLIQSGMPFLSIDNSGFSTLVENGDLRLLLSTKNGSWTGRVELSQTCKIPLRSEKFRQINAWKSVYRDSNIDLVVSIGAMNEFVRINITRASACKDLNDIKLGQIVIYGMAKVTPVIGTTRTAILPLPIDIDEMQRLYQSGGEL